MNKNRVSRKNIEDLIDQFSTAILADTSERKTAIMCIDKVYFRVSMMYAYKKVVFTHERSNNTVVKEMI